LTEYADKQCLDIDPVAQNIVNRIAAGSHHVGTFRWQGGLIIQGKIEGEITVTGGAIVLMPEGEMSGVIRGDGEAILGGKINPRSSTELSEVDVAGSVYLAETLTAHANITAASFQSFEGAQVEGKIKTLRRQG